MDWRVFQHNISYGSGMGATGPVPKSHKFPAVPTIADWHEKEPLVTTIDRTNPTVQEIGRRYGPGRFLLINHGQPGRVLTFDIVEETAYVERVEEIDGGYALSDAAAREALEASR